MVYSDVVKNKYFEILGEKNKYTKKDVKKVLSTGRFTFKQALFIVKCTAMYFDKEFSKVLYKCVDELLMDYQLGLF